MSLDIVLGACIGAFFFGQLIGIPSEPVVIAELGLAVWLIYTADHLLDAQKIKHKAHTRRHLFHQKYRKQILTIFFLVLAVALGLLPFLPLRTLSLGLIPAGSVLLYFSVLQLLGSRSSPHKEPVIAVIYGLGVFLPAFSSFQGEWPSWFVILPIQYIGLALANLLEFSYFEIRTDKRDGHGSFVRFLGEKGSFYLIIFLLLSTLTLPFIIFFLNENSVFPNEFWQAQHVLQAMNLALALILLFPDFFRKKERYRTLGDGIFLFPLVPLVLEYL